MKIIRRYLVLVPERMEFTLLEVDNAVAMADVEVKINISGKKSNLAAKMDLALTSTTQKHWDNKGRRLSQNFGEE